MFLFKVGIAVIAAIIQINPWFEVGGVKPNLALIVAVSFVVFERELWKKLVVLLLMAVIIKTGPALEIPTIIFVLITLLSIPLTDYFRLEREAAIGVTVLIGVLALNLTAGPSFFLKETGVIISELLYTAALGFIVVPLSKFLYEKEQFPKSRA